MNKIFVLMYQIISGCMLKNFSYYSDYSIFFCNLTGIKHETLCRHFGIRMLLLRQYFNIKIKDGTS